MFKLDYILKNGAMSEKMACEKFSQIISAVEYCHTKNIVHRDLKVVNLAFIDFKFSFLILILMCFRARICC